MLDRQDELVEGVGSVAVSTCSSGEEQHRGGARRAGAVSGARARESGDLVQSFNHAFEGVIHVVRTQRNMRLHFGAALIVLPLGLVLGVSRLEMLVLILAVGFVIVAEMFNTAVEMALDVATNSFDPRARIAKDVAAGTVLVAAVDARFWSPTWCSATTSSSPASGRSRAVRNSPVHITVIAMAVVILLVIATKAYFARGTPLRGGLPSGHAAVAFGGWAAITFVDAGQLEPGADLDARVRDGAARGPDAGRGGCAHARSRWSYGGRAGGDGDGRHLPDLRLALPSEVVMRL